MIVFFGGFSISLYLKINEFIFQNTKFNSIVSLISLIDDKDGKKALFLLYKIEHFEMNLIFKLMIKKEI